MIRFGFSGSVRRPISEHIKRNRLRGSLEVLINVPLGTKAPPALFKTAWRKSRSLSSPFEALVNRYCHVESWIFKSQDYLHFGSGKFCVANESYRTFRYSEIERRIYTVGPF